MGIFTDESHVERIQTDEEKAGREAVPKDERDILTERTIRQDVAMRAMDATVRAVFMAVACAGILSFFWLMSSYPFAACFVIGLIACVFLLLFIYYAARAVRFMRFGRKIHVYRTIVTGYARPAIAYILSYRFRMLIGDMILLKDYRALPDDLSRFRWHIGIGTEVYVVTFDHKTSVEIYPCSRFRPENEEPAN